MSMLLRSALLYNCRRRLGQLDSLKTVLAEKVNADDDDQDTVPAESGQSDRNRDLTAGPRRLSEDGKQYKQRLANMEASPESGFPAEKANATWKDVAAKEANRCALNAKMHSPDGADGREVDNGSSRSGSKCSPIGDTNDHNVYNRSPKMRKNNTSTYRGARSEDQKSNRSTGLDTSGSSSSNHSHISAAAKTVLTRTDAVRLVNTHRCHLNRGLTIDAVLHRITQAISESLRRFNNEQAQRSSSLIVHFWHEAARLKGSVPVQSPRMQQKAFFAADWGAGEEIDGPNDNGIETPRKKAKRYCKSPLAISFRPDDLIWEDQLSSWQLGIGRARDEEGRRCLKL